MSLTHGSRACDMLPPVRGTYTYDAPLKDLVWFRAGGPAEILFRPADAEDLATFLAARPAELRLSSPACRGHDQVVLLVSARGQARVADRHQLRDVIGRAGASATPDDSAGSEPPV